MPDPIQGFAQNEEDIEPDFEHIIFDPTRKKYTKLERTKFTITMIFVQFNEPGKKYNVVKKCSVTICPVYWTSQ